MLPFFVRRSLHLGRLAVMLCAFATSFAARGQAGDSGAKLAPADLREDFSLLQRALREAHPGLDRYATADELQRAALAVEEALHEPLGEIEFLRHVAGYLALIRDDHTYALPSAEFWKTAIGPTHYLDRSSTGTLPLFPFFLKVTPDHRVFITHNNSAVADIPRGTEILRINARPIADVLATLSRFTTTSGFTPFRRRRFEQFSPRQEYNGFCVAYALFLETPETFGLELRPPGATTPQTVTVPAVRAPELWAHFRERYVGTDDPVLARERPLQLSFPREDTARLVLTAFHEWRWRRAGLDYRKAIPEAFAALRERHTPTLIVDLRGNEGGTMEIAVEVLHHLAVQPYQIYAYKEMKAWRFPDLAAHLRNPRDLDHFTDDLFEPAGDGRFRIKTSLPGETWSRPLDPAPEPFAGRLLVLIDGATGSAAAQLATLVRVNRRDAIFVGEESGGDMEGPVSGSYLELTLPHSGIRVDIPILKKVLNLNGHAHQRGHGVIPDHAIPWTQDDIATGADPELDFALSHRSN